MVSPSLYLLFGLTQLEPGSPGTHPPYARVPSLPPLKTPYTFKVIFSLRWSGASPDAPHSARSAERAWSVLAEALALF